MAGKKVEGLNIEFDINNRIYLDCPRNNLNLIRLIEPLTGIEIGYTIEEFKEIIKEEKERKKKVFKNAKID